MNLPTYARKRAGLSQRQFALAIGVSRSSVARWEGERVEPMGPAYLLLRLIADNKDVAQAVRERVA